MALVAALVALSGCTAQEWTAWHNVFGGQDVVLCGIDERCDAHAGQRLDVLVKANVTDWDAEWVRDWCDRHGGREVIAHPYLSLDGREWRYDVVCEGVDF